METAFITPIEVSARHIHLNQEAVDVLFGKNYQLKNKRELSQKGYFVAEERVEVIGEKNSASFGILTPLRTKTQIELSITDALKLGIKPVLRSSGELVGSAGCILRGPVGEMTLNEGVIVAKRHIHMNEDQAKRFGIVDKEIVDVVVEGDRGLTFNHVIVRTDPSFDTSMHIDTDEANAIGMGSHKVYGVIKKI